MEKEIYLVQAEYEDCDKNRFMVSPIGWTGDYAKAKKVLAKVVNEDISEYEMDRRKGWWNVFCDEYHYEDENRKYNYYITTLDEL